MTITEMQREAWHIAETKGLHDDLVTLEPRQATLVQLGLLQTEVSEALEELTEPLEVLIRLLVLHRHISQATQRVKKQRFPDVTEALGKELADIVIRTGDLAGCLGIDLEAAIVQKLQFNATRPYRFGTPQEETGV